MPTNESYQRLRDEALQLNDAGRPFSLCRGIDGGCCIRDIKLLPEDQSIILEAAKRGDIPAETMQRARRRALDPSINACAFLGEQCECTIYAYRPVVCIQHGNGGLPTDKATALKALQKPGNRTIRIGDIEQFACDACAAHAKPNDRIPLSIVGKSVAILITVQEGERHYGRPRMNQFVIENVTETEPAAVKS
jgi:Fe-S-cluster containining protein